MEEVDNIIKKTKVLADRLNSAIAYQNTLIYSTQDGFDSTSKNFSKILEQLEDRSKVLEKTLLGLQDEVANTKCEIDGLSEKYQAILEENSSLKKKEEELLKETKSLQDERIRTAHQLQNKLKIYKLLTGVRFEFKNAKDILSGYIALTDKQQKKSTFVPFEIDKHDARCHHLLWDKINEACTEIIEYN